MISERYKLKLLDRKSEDLIKIKSMIEEELSLRENQELDAIERGLI
jgi:hypothetical protein